MKLKDFGKILLSWIVVPGIISYVFLQLEEKERIPTFFDDETKLQILSKPLMDIAPIKIFRSSNNEPIKNNVYYTNYFFFNQGDESIKRENILKNISISVKDTTAEILDFLIIKTSRPETGIKLTGDSLKKNKLNLDFKILEDGDGFAGQMIYTCSGDPDLQIDGTIEGSKRFRSYMETSLIDYLAQPGIIFLVICFVFIGGVFFMRRTLNANGNSNLFTKYEVEIRNPENIAEHTSMRFTYVRVIALGVIVFASLFLLSLFMTQTFLARWFNPRYKHEYKIPEGLKVKFTSAD
jgi:hypothetical protein